MSPCSSALPRRSRVLVFHARRTTALALLALTLALAGCATLPSGKPDPSDRFERFNRSVYKFNTALDHAILRPVARQYVKVTPQTVRTGVNNVLTNLAYPVTLVNNFLQGKLTDGMTDVARFLVNSTIGIGGLFDPASGMGLDRHQADFGQTMGRWGMHSGPYLMLPFLGPSTVRDAFGLVPDYLLLHEIETVKLFDNNQYVQWSLFAIGTVNRRSQLLDEDHILDSAYDPYAFLRNVYLQRRDYLIHDGNVSPEEQFPDADMTGAEPAAPAAPATPATPATPAAPAAPAAPK
jgi:phospholipid-binding lipoprotein MlaA